MKDRPRERPILFSGPMVRAILERRLTPTRRVIKDAPVGRAEWLCNENDVWQIRCPYGQPGDLLWVRETWGSMTQDTMTKHRLDQIRYRANYSDGFCPMAVGKWRPSTHMPKWACRLWLRVTDNAKRDHEWDVNDWVWVVSLERVDHE